MNAEMIKKAATMKLLIQQVIHLTIELYIQTAYQIIITMILPKEMHKTPMKYVPLNRK